MIRRRFQSAIPGPEPCIGEGEYVSVVFDKSISDPANIEIQDNECILEEILSQFRRCLCKKTDEGVVSICYLNDSDSNFYENGDAAILTGDEGDVMVNFPEFWYKWVKVDENRFAYRFALYDVEGDWVHVRRSLLGAYKGYVENGKLYSRSGVTPYSPLNKNYFYNCVENRGPGYQLIDFQQHCVIAFMLYAKYKTRGIQSFLGMGGAISDPETTKTGTSNSTGNADTQNETSGYVCGLGIEGVFGGINEWVDGVYASYDYRINKIIWTITNPDGSTRDVYAVPNSGYITGIAAEDGPYFDIVPTAINKTDATHYLSYYLCIQDRNNCFMRSGGDSWEYNNVSYTDAQNSYVGIACATRLAFRGTINEIQNVSEFKNLPLL